MLVKYIDPDVRDSFWAAGGAFVAKSERQVISNPVFKIASIATRRVVDGANLELPEGYDNNTLENVEWLAGFQGKEVSVSGRQAEELAQIGAQLLALNEQGSIQPPLDYFEEHSITHLVQLVGQTTPSQQTSPTITEEA